MTAPELIGSLSFTAGCNLAVVGWPVTDGEARHFVEMLSAYLTLDFPVPISGLVVHIWIMARTKNGRTVKYIQVYIKESVTVMLSNTPEDREKRRTCDVHVRMSACPLSQT